jgi:acyl-CoA thioesterase FadM
MYPVVRLIKDNLKARFQPPLGLFETHVSHHICWPWDIDPWMELNNGRALTLFDLGRMPFSARLGMITVLRANGWGMAAAGNSVRYRRRVRAFQRVEMRTRMLGWDRRFLYVEQAMWRRGEALNHMLIRIAATNAAGIVPPQDLIARMGADPASPPLPGWVAAWIEADAQRPWPPLDAAGPRPESSI